jgi:hypothetical protein
MNKNGEVVKMREDVLRVLKMIEEGKVDAEKGAQLIEALKGKDEGGDLGKKQAATDEKFFRVRVDSKTGDKVNVNIPLNLIKSVIGSVGGKFPIKAEGYEGSIDMEIIKQALDNDITGRIVDVESANGDKVEVYIE